MLYYLQSASKCEVRLLVFNMQIPVWTILTIVVHIAQWYKVNIKKILVCKLMKKLEQNSLDGSAPARLDIWASNEVFNTWYPVYHWLSNYDPQKKNNFLVEYRYSCSSNLFSEKKSAENQSIWLKIYRHYTL